MPKMKTNKSAAKRFKVTATGKVKRSHAFHRHILSSKSRKRKNKLIAPAMVDKANLKKVKRMLVCA
ncbi:MAG: 50S ribosomal protein L35 [Acidobacteria bacterium]|nr:50S ribosomal protein L35 [Acidobacteriota bacterium]